VFEQKRSDFILVKPSEGHDLVSPSELGVGRGRRRLDAVGRIRLITEIARPPHHGLAPSLGDDLA
jgi:hypothetical protein